MWPEGKGVGGGFLQVDSDGLKGCILNSISLQSRSSRPIDTFKRSLKTHYISCPLV